MCVEFDEFFWRFGPAEEVVGDENLAIAGVASADTDRGDRKLGSELACEGARNTLEDESEGAGVLEGEGF